MNPDTPQFGQRTGGEAPSVSLGSGLDAVRPAEFSDASVEDSSAEGPRGFAGSVKEKAKSQLNAQKSRATDQLDSFAQSVRQSTRRLRDERHDAVAAVLERGVDELERFAARLRDRDIDEFLADLERFGRRQPALFLGSSLAAGLILARFAKASDADAARFGGGGSARSGRSRYNSFKRPGGDFTGQENL
jgi:hypothetical protein